MSLYIRFAGAKLALTSDFGLSLLRALLILLSSLYTFNENKGRKGRKGPALPRYPKKTSIFRPLKSFLFGGLFSMEKLSNCKANFTNPEE